MLADADVHFLKWSLGAVLRWRGPKISPNIPTLTIAAGKDLILPSRRMRAAHVVESAGHTVNVTHSAEVHLIIADWLAEQVKNDHRTYNQAYGQLAS